MADAELYNEIYGLIGCHSELEFRDGFYFQEAVFENMEDDMAHDIIAMHAIRWLGERGWRTLFIKSDRIKCGYAPDGGICDLSITGPVAQTLCEAIKRQLEREEK